MSSADNVIEQHADNARPGAPRLALGPGVALGALGILGFSMSLPATRLAVARPRPVVRRVRPGVGAGLLAVALPARSTRAPRPTAAQWRSLAIVALGVVVGFPLFTSLALEAQTAAHGAVVIALLPAATAVFAVAARAASGRRGVLARRARAGLVAVLVFIAASGGDRAARVAAPPTCSCSSPSRCARLGYAEGGALARDARRRRRRSAGRSCSALPGARRSPPWPRATTGRTPARPRGSASPTSPSISMFLGFFAWYAGLARGGVARVGQVQLAQPVLTLVWSALVLGESVGAFTLVAALAVLASVAATQRAR